MLVIVNAITAKNKTGGAFQVVLNFVRQTKLTPNGIRWGYFLSEDVYQVIKDEFVESDLVFVFPTQPDFKHTYYSVKKKLNRLEDEIKPDLIYTIKAPSYFRFRTKEVLRFTNPWVTHPNKFAWRVRTLRQRVEMSAYIILQKLLIKRAKWFVTQTEQAKTGLLSITHLPQDHVAVIPNVLPASYSNVSRKRVEVGDGNWHVISVSAPIIHKNLDIIPSVLDVLVNKYGINRIRFHLTLPEDSYVYKTIKLELDKLGLASYIINHGRCTQAELAELYRQSDLAFLPTLLEVFSVSSLEAMFFHLPIVTTDFDFNREVDGDAALYYIPTNSSHAADCIMRVLEDEDLRMRLVSAGDRRLCQFADYEAHYSSTVDFLKIVYKHGSNV